MTKRYTIEWSSNDFDRHVQGTREDGSRYFAASLERLSGGRIVVRIDGSFSPRIARSERDALELVRKHNSTRGLSNADRMRWAPASALSLRSVRS